MCRPAHADGTAVSSRLSPEVRAQFEKPAGTKPRIAASICCELPSISPAMILKARVKNPPSPPGEAGATG